MVDLLDFLHTRFLFLLCDNAYFDQRLGCCDVNGGNTVTLNKAWVPDNH